MIGWPQKCSEYINNFRRNRYNRINHEVETYNDFFLTDIEIKKALNCMVEENLTYIDVNKYLKPSTYDLDIDKIYINVTLKKHPLVNYKNNNIHYNFTIILTDDDYQLCFDEQKYDESSDDTLVFDWTPNTHMRDVYTIFYDEKEYNIEYGQGIGFVCVDIYGYQLFMYYNKNNENGIEILWYKWNHDTKYVRFLLHQLNLGYDHLLIDYNGNSHSICENKDGRDIIKRGKYNYSLEKRNVADKLKENFKVKLATDEMIQSMDLNYIKNE